MTTKLAADLKVGDRFRFSSGPLREVVAPVESVDVHVVRILAKTLEGPAVGLVTGFLFRRGEILDLVLPDPQTLQREVEDLREDVARLRSLREFEESMLDPYQFAAAAGFTHGFIAGRGTS